MNAAQENHTGKEEREALLNRGYDALSQGSWEQADQIFGRLLQQDPHCGMSCLGKAMAARQIHNRMQLSESWDQLQMDSEFMAELGSAKEDFLPWLQSDMASLQKEKQEISAVDFMDLTLLLPDFSLMETGRKLLLLFAAVQVLLYLTVAFFIGKTGMEEETFAVSLAGSLVAAAIFTGLPVILGPVYGNSIVEAGRFCRVLKFINNTAAVLGCGISAIMVAAFYDSYQSGTEADFFYCAAFSAAFFAHLLALIVPIILDKVEYG